MHRATPCAVDGTLCKPAVEVATACGSSTASPRHSLIVAVRDRHESLARVLPSWLAVEELDELVIVDWGSQRPLDALLPHDHRVHLVRAPLEREWTLARAYNLAAQVARGSVLLKVDADTWLDRSFLAMHRLPLRRFIAGDWRTAPNENAQHLNGVVLVRRADFAAVGGYDERLRGYGWDDTDLYVRLEAGPTALTRQGFANHSLIRHDGTQHAHRGAHWAATEFLHRRAVAQVWRRWHLSGLPPSTWTLLLDEGAATAGASAAGASRSGRCSVHCVHRPPYFDELLDTLDGQGRQPVAGSMASGGRADGGAAESGTTTGSASTDGGSRGDSIDSGLMAVEWRLAYSAAIGRVVNGSIPPRALQRVASLADYRSLLVVYESLLHRQEPWLAVHARGPLAQRLLIVCAARIAARRAGRRLLLIWSADSSLRAPLAQLIDMRDKSVRVLGHFDERLFPSSLWQRADAGGTSSVADGASIDSAADAAGDSAATAFALAASAPTAARALLLRASRPLVLTPLLVDDVAQVATSRCLREDLRPSRAVAALVAPLNASAHAAMGLHLCTTDGSASAVDRARPMSLHGARWESADATLASLDATASRDTAADVRLEAGAPPPPTVWPIECSEDGAAQAVHALRALQPTTPILLVVEPPGRWFAVQARLRAAALLPASTAEIRPTAPWLISLVDERERARCMSPALRGETPCAHLSLAELLLLGRTMSLVRSVGCTASEVASHLLPPGTPLHTCCRHTGSQAPLAFVEATRPLAATLPTRRPPPAATPAAGAITSESAPAADEETVVAPIVAQDPNSVTAAPPATKVAARERSREATAASTALTASTRRASGASRGVRVELLHDALLDVRLPAAMQAAKLIFVVPPTNRLRSIARKIQTTLDTTALPRLLAGRSGDVLSEETTVEEAQRAHGTGGGVLQIRVDSRSLDRGPERVPYTGVGSRI